MARTIDLAVAAAVGFAAAVVPWIRATQTTSWDSLGWAIMALVVGAGAALVTVVVNEAILASATGASLGMRMVEVELRRRDGTRARWWQPALAAVLWWSPWLVVSGLGSVVGYGPFADVLLGITTLAVLVAVLWPLPGGPLPYRAAGLELVHEGRSVPGRCPEKSGHDAHVPGTPSPAESPARSGTGRSDKESDRCGEQRWPSGSSEQ